MPKCQICQKDNPAGVEYCEDCGASLTTAPPVAAPATEATPGPVSPATTAPPAPTGSGHTRLVAKRHGVVTNEEIPLAAGRLTVGRFDAETGPVDIDLSGVPEAPQISRQHAEVYREADGRWYVKDLGSTNGVFVKAPADPSFGPRITAPRALSDQDEIAFGNARFVFRSS